jgi:cellulose synthase operon protein C
MNDGQQTERLVAPPGLTAPSPANERPGRRPAMSERDVAILRSLKDRIDPSDAGAQNNLGVVFFQKGLVAESVAAFSRALELDPDLDTARRNATVACVETGYYRRRSLELEDQLVRSPGDESVRDELARLHLLAGDAAAAVEVWEPMLAERPDSPTLHLKLAHALVEDGAIGRALALIDRAAAPDSADIGANLDAARLLLRIGELDGAEARARRALELEEGSARAHVVLGRILEAAGRVSEARAAVDRAESLDPSVRPSAGHLSLERYRSASSARRLRPQAEPVEAALGLYARAGQLRRAGDLAGAAELLERGGGTGADAFEVDLALAEIRLLQGDFERAAGLYERLTERRENSPKIWNERGVALHRLGRLDAAMDSYRRAVALDHTYLLGWNNLGVAQVQKGDEGSGERALRQAAAPGAPGDVLRNLALFLLRSDQADEAVEVSRAAVAMDESLARSWGRLGSALFQARRNAEARDALLRALELDAEDAEARYQLGFVLSGSGDFQGALRETKRALELDPVFPAPRYRLLVDVDFEDGAVPAPDTDIPQRVLPGTAIPSFEFEPEAFRRAFDRLVPAAASPESDPEPFLDQAREALHQGRLRRAGAHLRQAEALRPADPEVLLLRGEVFLLQGLAGEALERFEAILATDPDRADAAVGRARALLDLGRVDEAIPAARVARGRGGGRDAAEALGRALLAAGDGEGAVAAFEEAIGNGTPAAGALIGYGHALMAAARPADAARAFRTALGHAPGTAAARVGLAKALESLGRGPEAEVHYREAVRVLPSYAPGVHGLADLLWRSDRPQAALRAVVDLLGIDPTDAEALVRLGIWLAELGRMAQARAALRRALRFDPGNLRARSALDRVGEMEAD